MTEEKTIGAALERFAETVTEKLTQLTAGEPEDQLRAPFENFMADVANVLGWKVVCTGETPLPGRLGRPDYAVHLNDLLAGYVELKAPGVGANPARFKGHNREQWKRFTAIPNLLYSDGNEWALYRGGELVDKIVRLSGDVSTDGKKAATPQDAHALERLLRDFFSWRPIIPFDRNGKIELKGFAALLAPLCRMLREDVADALKDPASPLIRIAKDWRQLLFPGAQDDQFADAYAQTVTFALLLARGEGADPLDLDRAETTLKAEHNLLSRALQVLTDPGARKGMAASLDLLLRVIAVVPPATLTGPKDPWLYFYEDFLAAYDPKLRKDAGAYYTPLEVVRAQVRLIDDLLVNRLGKPLGFADAGVVTLDPAAGTGTYLLGVIEHALTRIEKEQGAGAVPGMATALAENLHGFELMVGPYAVTELRVNRALRDRGATIPKDGTRIYLTDTLESPSAKPSELPFYLEPIAEQHAKALKVKSQVPVIVCLGNPPYDRHEAAGEDNKARAGGWVRWGDDGKGYRFAGDGGSEDKFEEAIFHDFLDPAVKAGHGVRVHNLYNLYVYFWRWALWKVFEHETIDGPGVVSFISASSYLDGDAFCGMREHLRRLCDEIWIIDLGGEGRGTRKTDNVFAIQTPVAIAIAFRSGKASPDQPASVHYVRVKGTRKKKLDALNAIGCFNDMRWKKGRVGWRDSFLPPNGGAYFQWPQLIDLLPWHHSGVKAGRTWVMAPEKESLIRCWRLLCKTERSERAKLFKDSPTGRKATDTPSPLKQSNGKLTAIVDLPTNEPPPSIVRYAFRSFDRQYVFADNRLLDRPSPSLWMIEGDRQLFLTTLLNHPLGDGPALTTSVAVPDLHHFRGSFGAKESIPLYRDANATEANLLPGLLDLLGKTYKRKVTPEDLVAYVYGALAQPAFTARYAKELETRELRVPLTKDAALFKKIGALGARLLWLHTYGERFTPAGQQPGQVPRGEARCVKAVPGDPDGYPESFAYDGATRTLRVGAGEFAPVAPELFAFEVSGLKVVQSWLKYRMKKGSGKKSSPLDDVRPERWTGQFTTELLELLWVLEATLETYPEQEKLLGEAIAGPCFHADELPPVPPASRKPPRLSTIPSLFDDQE